MNLRSTLLILCLFASSGGSGAEPDRWSIGFDTGIRYDDNIGLSSDAAITGESVTGEEFDDTTVRIAANVAYSLIQDQGQELELSATPFYEKVRSLDDLSNYGIKVGAAYRGEFGSDFTDPWYSVSAGYTFINFDNSDIRDGGWLDAELAVGKRFSPRFGFSVGLRYFDRDQSDTTNLCPTSADGRCLGELAADVLDQNSGSVFELSKWGTFAHADLFLGSKTSLFFEYSYWDGAEATSGSFNGFSGQNPQIGRDTFAADPAFGSFSTPQTSGPFLVWRIDAKQHIFELGMSRELTDSLGVDLTLIHLETNDVSSPDRINSDIDRYRNTAIELGFRYRFQ